MYWIDDENKVLIGKRPVGKAFENLWEFPGGKVKKNETVEQGLIREIREEIKVLSKTIANIKK